VESLHGPAKEAYVSAEVLFKAGDYAGAVIKYESAYGLSKDPRLLFDMALAEKSLHAYARMKQLLEQYEREAGPSITQDDKAAVDRALAAIRNLVGSVSISVDVAGASVAVDGQLVGTTPLAGPLVLDLGKHTLAVQKPGFETATRALEITGGSAAPVTVALAAVVQAGQLVVSAEPEATIIVDSTAPVKERFDERLPVGTHQVTVTAPGKKPYTAEVDLRDRETRTLQVTLVEESRLAVWPWIAGGAAVVAGGAVAAYFLLQQSPQQTNATIPQGPLGNYTLASWRGK
jgi:hypothetical protein